MIQNTTSSNRVHSAALGLRVVVVALALACLFVTVDHFHSDSGLERGVGAHVNVELSQSKCAEKVARSWQKSQQNGASVSGSGFSSWLKHDEYFGEMSKLDNMWTNAEEEAVPRMNIVNTAREFGFGRGDPTRLLSSDEEKLSMVWNDATKVTVDLGKCRVTRISFPRRGMIYHTVDSADEYANEGSEVSVKQDACPQKAKCERTRATGVVDGCRHDGSKQHCPTRWRPIEDKYCYLHDFHLDCLPHNPNTKCSDAYSNLHGCGDFSKYESSCRLLGATACSAAIDTTLATALTKEEEAALTIMNGVIAVGGAVVPQLGTPTAILGFVLGEVTPEDSGYDQVMKKMVEAVNNLRGCIKEEIAKSIVDGREGKLQYVKDRMKPSEVGGEESTAANRINSHWGTPISECNQLGIDLGVTYLPSKGYTYEWGMRLIPLALRTAQQCGLMFLSALVDYKATNHHDLSKVIGQFQQLTHRLRIATNAWMPFIETALRGHLRCGYWQDTNQMVTTLIAGYKQRISSVVEVMYLAAHPKKCFPRVHNYQYSAGAGLTAFLIGSVDLCEAECKKNVHCGCYVMHGFTCWLNSQCTRTLGAFAGATTAICTNRACSARISNAQYSCSAGLTAFLIDSVDLCEAECLKEPLCQGYVMHGFTCWLNSQCTETTAAFAGATSALCKS